MRPAVPDGFRTLGYPRAGITVALPGNWSVLSERAPEVAVASSGMAVIALWRFPRSEAPPVGSVELGDARDALLATAKSRDAGLKVIRSSLLMLDRQPAVELDAYEQIDGRLRRVRSVHIYLPGAEVVLDEYAPPAQFHSVDHFVFSPVRRSLRLLSGSST